jgi:hypothetical protein
LDGGASITSSLQQFLLILILIFVAKGRQTRFAVSSVIVAIEGDGNILSQLHVGDYS